MGRNLMRKFHSWNLDKKIFTFVTSLIYCISIIVLAVFTTFYISSFIRQSNSIMKNHLSAMANNYKYTLDNYKELAESLTIDDSIQEYITSDGQKDKEYFDLVNNAKNTLQNALNMYSNMEFIAIISNNFDDILYKGKLSKISSTFPNVYEEDYADSMYPCEKGTLRMNFNNTYLPERDNMLNVYMPVYSVTKMINDNGLICMIFNGSLFQGISGKNTINVDSEVLMVDGTNSIISSTGDDVVGTTFEYTDMLQGVSGNFKIKSILYNYQKIEKWNFYLISKIPLMDMYRDNIFVVAVWVFLSVVVSYLGLIVCKRIISRTYQPLDNIVKEMKYVAEGNLDIRINMENVGIDFVKLADGFNYMMEEINTLMVKVRQMDQIRFNALQSQIQPHFLYNTLDCMHWQAVAAGNEEVSILIKALAQYYRLCLSNGKDVIPLDQELENVRNYLIIQNMRYDNIIHYEINLDPRCRDVLIPKITLQPIVENSIYHGIKVKEGRQGELLIIIRKKNNDVYIVVSDNGTGMTEEQIIKMNNSLSEYDKDFGYGVRNVNKRIEILFGKEYGLHYEKNEWGGVTVIIHLPSDEVHQCKEVL